MSQPPVSPSPVPTPGYGWEVQPKPDVALAGPLRWTALFCAICSALGVVTIAVLLLLVVGLVSTLEGGEGLRDELGSASPVLWIAGAVGAWLLFTLVAFVCSAAFLGLLRLIDGFRKLPGVAQAAIAVFGLQSFVGTVATLAGAVSG